MDELNLLIDALNCFGAGGNSPECPCMFRSDDITCETKVAQKAQEFLKAMYEQIESTHSCRLCANANACSPDAEFDTPEYQMFAGCRGSMKENWKWKGID